MAIKYIYHGMTITINKIGRTRLIENYATNRAVKDEHNRTRGLQRMENGLRQGCNKYLRLKGNVTIRN